VNKSAQQESMADYDIMSLGPLKEGSTHLEAKSPLRIKANGL